MSVPAAGYYAHVISLLAFARTPGARTITPDGLGQHDLGQRECRLGGIVVYWTADIVS